MLMSVLAILIVNGDPRPCLCEESHQDRSQRVEEVVGK